MGAVTADDLATFTGRPVDAGQANAVIQVVTALASTYTRGKGFVNGVPNDGIRAVIVTASARLLADPSQVVAEESMGPFSVSFTYSHSLQWSTGELAVLNAYRVRAW